MIIAYAVGYGFDTFVTQITVDLMFILYMLFSSTGHAIWTITGVFTTSFESDPFNWAFFILYFSFILAPLIASIIVGQLSENRVHAFAGFFLATIICMLVCIILVYYSFTYVIFLGVTFNLTEAILNVVFGSLVNGLIYGIIAYLTTKK
jgi:hypothetical protein